MEQSASFLSVRLSREMLNAHEPHTVFSLRPFGHQTNEVVLDNTNRAVTFAGS
jgi:hypothetical protein